MNDAEVFAGIEGKESEREEEDGGEEAEDEEGSRGTGEARYHLGEKIGVAEMVVGDEKRRREEGKGTE